MMKNRLLLPVVVALLACGLWAAPAAANIHLYDWSMNIDGTLSEWMAGHAFPVDDSSFDLYDASTYDDLGTGLGTITVEVTGVGSHYVGLFVDHEIDEGINTWYNENGEAVGTAAAGQSWEIDEPGYSFGDIYTNIGAGALDNSNAVPAGLEDDVSMAMAWAFTIPDMGLGGSEWAEVVFELSTTAPTSGFYLAQHDPDSDEHVYFSSSLTVVPLPGAVMLGALGLGVAGRLVGRFNRRRTRT